jgi:catechol 2,3-dioxygenase-like lactoylglutathione lyase family enzyme
MMGGVNHITFAVRDLERSFRFYVEVLGATPVARWYKGAYVDADGSWICLTLDESVRMGPLPEYTHVAFTVSQDRFAGMVERLRDTETVCWQENHSEGDSYYFLDPDGHKLEIHVGCLQDRMRALKARPPRDLVLFPPYDGWE